LTRWIAAAALAMAVTACSAAPPPSSRAASAATNVLVVTIDTLRADRVGIYGAANVATPNIDALAREGAWAARAVVHAPLTRPSHVSLFTGRYPAEHGIRDNVSPPLAANVPVLAEAFKRAGFATAAFVASAVVDRQSGLARGFDLYSDRFDPGEDRKAGDRVIAEATAWIGGRSRFFAWVHLYDPHAPYLPPGRYAAEYHDRPYDGTVGWSDELIGRLTGALRGSGALDSTLVIVTSDHGESLGEHGEDVHGYFVYEATLRVPLVIRGPGVRPGTRVDTLARTIDLYPTILDMTGVAGDASSGRSLAPALRSGAAMPDESSFAESLVPLLHYGWSDLRAVNDGRWKYILAPKPELFDLQNDPGELRNLVAAEPARASALRAAVEARLRVEQSALKSSPSSAGVSAEVLERLGALGYVGPGRSVSPKPDTAKSGRAKADPKDKLADYKALSTAMQDAIVALRAKRYADALRGLQTVVARGVDSVEVHQYLGRAYAGLGRWREAATEFDKAVTASPEDGETWRALGEARVALGDRQGAIRAFEKLTALAPKDAVALMQLGEAYRDLARYDEASKAIQAALAIDPAPAQYWNSLGTVLGARGKMAEAERAFAEATAREPANGMYVYNRALALRQLGRRGEAAAQFIRARELGYR
jgi:arylsulfatase A-like enzyme/Flp pilus assembly protein TadD